MTSIRLFLHDMTDALRRRIAYLLVPVAVLFLTATVIAFLLPAEFESTGRIGVRPLPLPPDSASGIRLPVPENALREALMDSSLGEDAGEGHLEAADGGVFTLGASGGDPDAARARARRLLEHAVRRANIADSVLLATLGAAGAGPPPRPAGGGDTAGPPNRPSGQEEARVLRGSLARAVPEREEAERKLAEATALDSAGRSLLASLEDPAIVAGLAAGETPVGLPGRAAIHAAAGRAADLMNRYTLRHPEVQSARAALRSLLGRSVAALSRAREEAVRQAAERTGREEELRSRLAALAAADTPLPAAAPPAPRTAAPTLAGAAGPGNDLLRRHGPRFVILRQPDLPREPVRPLRAFIIAGGAAAGLLLGLIAVAGAEAFDPTIRRAADLKVFGKPVIASLP